MPAISKSVDFLQRAPFETPPVPRYAAKEGPLLGMIGKEGGSSGRAVLLLFSKENFRSP